MTMIRMMMRKMMMNDEAALFDARCDYSKLDLVALWDAPTKTINLAALSASIATASLTGSGSIQENRTEVLLKAHLPPRMV
jgi:hypothetical protein